MNKEEVFTHILSELKKHKCVSIPVRNGIFPRWQSERNKYICRGVHNGENVREILPNEIVMEFDGVGNNPIEKIQEESKKWIDEIKAWLDKHEYSFYETNHGGKSSHIRFQIQGLEDLDFEIGKKYKQTLTKLILKEIRFGCDILKLDESLINTKNKLLSLELQPHFKSKYNNAIEDIIYINWGKVNRIDPAMLQYVKQKQPNTRKLTDDYLERNDIDMGRLIEYFGENYIGGSRNHLTLALGGMLYYKGFPLDDTEEILEKILIKIGANDFEERRKEISYCFDSGKNISVRAWINEIYSNLSEDKREEKYREFKQIFEKSKNQFVQVKSGKFYVEVENNMRVLKYIDNKTQNVYTERLEHFNNLNKFNIFNKKNKIELGDKPENIFSEINKLNKVIKLTKGCTQDALDTFFDETEYYDNNQLFYEGRFAYTMCNGQNTLLVTFDSRDIISDASNFRKLYKIKSNVISPAGLRRLQKKLVNSNIFNEVKNLLNDYLDYEEEDLVIITLWIFHTYLFNVQGNTVYLHFVGMPGTGKSTGQKVTNKLCWNSEYVCSLSESALFRDIDVLQNTLHIDELDKWGMEKQQSMQGLLNNGYSQGGRVKRVGSSDNNFKTESFRVFSPKTITSNNPRFLDSFKTRCIDIVPQRTTRNLKNIDFLSDSEKKRFIRIRDDIYIYMLKYGKEILDIFKKEISNPSRISNRENQLSSVLNCFNIHFKQNLDLNQILENKRDEFEPSFDHYYLILEALVGKTEDNICIITTKELSEMLTMKLYGEYPNGRRINEIVVGNKMKNLGLKQYKKQTLTGQRYHHYAIPKKAIEKKILAMNFDIRFEKSNLV